MVDLRDPKLLRPFLMLSSEFGKERRDQRFEFRIPTKFISIQLSVSFDGPTDIAHSVRANDNHWVMRWVRSLHSILHISHRAEQTAALRNR